jgi:hypothetical protein
MTMELASRLPLTPDSTSVGSGSTSKPDVWFTGPGWPAELTVTFSAPPAWTGTEDEWHAMLVESVKAQEKSLQQERIRTQSTLMGVRGVLEQSPTDAPKTKPAAEPERNPTIATGGDAPLMKAEIAVLKAWRRAYREALDRWRCDKAQVFPLGTFLRVVVDGALAA